MTTDTLIDAIEQRVDANRLTFSLARHPGLWVATARFPDGRQIALQASDDQRGLLSDILDAIDRVLARQSAESAHASR